MSSSSLSVLARQNADASKSTLTTESESETDKQNADRSKSTLTTESESETDSGPLAKCTKSGSEPEQDLEIVKVCG